MGAGISVRSNVDSVSFPNKKHVISGPLNKYGDKDAIFDQILCIARDPAQHIDKFTRRSLECIETEPNKFTVTVQKDGNKLSIFKLQSNSIDPTVESSVCRYNRERGTIFYESIDSKGGLANIESFIFLQNPLRLEFWLDAGGQHSGDKSAAALLSKRWLNPIVERMSKVTTVRVWDEVDSPNGDGKSAMSGPLDAYFTDKKLFSELVEELKEPPQGFHNIAQKRLPNGAYEQQVSNGTASIHLIHRAEPASGTVTVHARHGSLPLVDTHFAVHQQPLRLESWLTYGQGRVRLGGYSVGTELQDLVTRLVGRAQPACQVL